MHALGLVRVFKNIYIFVEISLEKNSECKKWGWAVFFNVFICLESSGMERDFM